MLCEVETNRFSDYLPLYQSGDATLGSDEYSIRTCIAFLDRVLGGSTKDAKYLWIFCYPFCFCFFLAAGNWPRAAAKIRCLRGIPRGICAAIPGTAS